MISCDSLSLDFCVLYIPTQVPNRSIFEVVTGNIMLEISPIICWHYAFLCFKIMRT